MILIVSAAASLEWMTTGLFSSLARSSCRLNQYLWTSLSTSSQ